MEKVDLNYLRNQWKDELGYYWGRAHKEIDEYFEMIKDTLCYNAEELKSKPKEDVLDHFSLNEGRLKDPLFIPEILNLLGYIKKINYDLFPDNWVSGEYNNNEHASYIYKTLIPKIETVAQKIKEFKITQYNNLYDSSELVLSKKKFIESDFERYGLIHYDYHLNLINNIAYHDKFYVILPNLLRTLFENILHDIFKTSLNDRHKTLYFDKDKGRVADFSVLINLLNKLSQLVYKNEIRENVTEHIIKILKNVKKKGNLSIHEVTRKVTKSHADEIQDEIDLALEALLVSYHQLKNANIIITSEILEKIEERLGLSKKDKNKKEREQKSQTQFLDGVGLEKYSFLVRLIYLLQKQKEIYHYERELLEIIEDLGPLIGKLDLIHLIKDDLTKYSKVDKFLGIPDYSNLDTCLELKDKNYKITYFSVNSAHWYEIEQLDTKSKFKSLIFGFRDYDKSSEFNVLDNFTEHLKRRMEELHLFPLIEEIEKKTRIMKKFFRLYRFLEYLFSDYYLNQNSIDIRNDERVMSELKWIEQNSIELNDLFTVFRRKDDPGQYNKILSLLDGKYLIQFRSHTSFSSLIKTKEELLESSNSRKVKTLLFMIFEEIKIHIKDNYNITI